MRPLATLWLMTTVTVHAAAAQRAFDFHDASDFLRYDRVHASSDDGSTAGVVGSVGVKDEDKTKLNAGAVTAVAIACVVLVGLILIAVSIRSAKQYHDAKAHGLPDDGIFSIKSDDATYDSSLEMPKAQRSMRPVAARPSAASVRKEKSSQPCGHSHVVIQPERVRVRQPWQPEEELHANLGPHTPTDPPPPQQQPPSRPVSNVLGGSDRGPASAGASATGVLRTYRQPPPGLFTDKSARCSAVASILAEEVELTPGRTSELRPPATPPAHNSPPRGSIGRAFTDAAPAMVESCRRTLAVGGEGSKIMT